MNKQEIVNSYNTFIEALQKSDLNALITIMGTQYCHVSGSNVMHGFLNSLPDNTDIALGGNTPEDPGSLSKYLHDYMTKAFTENPQAFTPMCMTHIQCNPNWPVFSMEQGNVTVTAFVGIVNGWLKTLGKPQILLTMDLDRGSNTVQGFKVTLM